MHREIYMHAAMQMCKSSVYAVNIGYHPLCMCTMHHKLIVCTVDPLKIYPGQVGAGAHYGPKRLA